MKREGAETMDLLDAVREALEAETASKRQEILAAEQKFITDSKVTEDSLKGDPRETRRPRQAAGPA